MRPILFSVGVFAFRSAPLLAGLSAVLAWLYFDRNREDVKFSAEHYWSLLLCLAVGVIGGGALLHMLLYGAGFRANAAMLLERRRVAGGAFYGSFWGAALLAWAFCRLKRVRFAPVADLLGPASLLALAVMRLGCLLNGCCHGRPALRGWGIVFTDPLCRVPDAWLGVPLHPTQIYESAGSLALFLAAHFCFLRKVRLGALRPGSAFAASVVLYAAMRFLLEFLKGTDPGILRAAGLDTAQWLAAASCAAALLMLRAWRAAP